jgi:flagellar export protein FliJ
MARFVFRAEGALTLRRQQEELAIRVRAEAAAAVDRAERHVAQIDASLADRLRAAATVHDPAQREWYRNWIAKQRYDIARAKAMLKDRRTALTTATARANAARRDVRTLEKLRERLYADWQRLERRTEQKELDWLATMRHVAAARLQENDR